MKCEFSKQHYFDCLLKAKELGYSIKRVCDYTNYKYQVIGSEPKYVSKDNDEKVILLRHDIDLSLDYAHKLATYENRFGIKSSYYIHLHSETYNALSPRNMFIIGKIQQLGHEIGFHYDAKYHVPTESLFVTKILPDGMKTYTLHNASYENKVMTFAHLKNPNDYPLKYISDSGRNWREGCMCQWIGKEDKLHILTHPIWWIKEGVRDKVIHEAFEDVKTHFGKGFQTYKKILQDYCRDLGIEY